MVEEGTREHLQSGLANLILKHARSVIGRVRFKPPFMHAYNHVPYILLKWSGQIHVIGEDEERKRKEIIKKEKVVH